MTTDNAFFPSVVVQIGGYCHPLQQKVGFTRQVYLLVRVISSTLVNSKVAWPGNGVNDLIYVITVEVVNCNANRRRCVT